jgi:FkbM family methyltransferase
MRLRKLVRRTLRPFGYEVRGLREIGVDPIRDLRRIFGTRAPAVIFDIGANTGQTAVRFARRFPDARIFSFEPDPQAFAALETNVASYPGVHTINAAVGDRDGKASFRINAENTTNSFLPTAEEAPRYWAAESFRLQELVEVEVRSLDAFCADDGIDAVDLLKIDAQGYELRIFDGARRLLSRKAITCIYAELLFVPFYEGQAFYHQVCGRLAEHGYRLVGFYDPVYTREGYLSWCDGLFVRG